MKCTWVKYILAASLTLLAACGADDSVVTGPPAGADVQGDGTTQLDTVSSGDSAGTDASGQDSVATDSVATDSVDNPDVVDNETSADVTGSDATDNEVTDPDSTTSDATDGDVTDPDAVDNDSATDNDSVTDPDSTTDNDAADNDATDPDVTDPDAGDPDAIGGDDGTGGDATDNDATDNDATGGDATDNDANGGDATDNDSTPTCVPTTPADEICDGIDNNCDGKTDEATCTDGECTTSVCGQAEDKTWGCVVTPKDGNCSDGNACTLDDVCKAGLCVGTPKVCDDNNACTIDTCTNGGCESKATTGDCDDGDACTEKDSCASGSCKGTAFDAGGKNACDDGNPCTKDACDPKTGCINTGDDGKTCDDGDACTEGDACFGGGCAGKTKACDDNNPCTVDSCDAKVGCVGKPADGGPCDDGDACTINDSCSNGTCAAGKAKDCDDNNPCTTDSCKDGSCGASPNDAASCDDGNACTDKDACSNGKCNGSAVKCDDGNVCTDDSCDPSAGCTKTPNSATCDDANACTDNDGCSGGTCKGSEKNATACDDNNACTKDSCDPKLGCQSVAAEGAPCDDGDACTNNDACDKNAKCQSGANVCECKLDADCKDDGDLCNGTPICQGNKCVTDLATVVVCDPSSNTGCMASTCVAKSGTCEMLATNEGKPCSDGNACTVGNTCLKGACIDGAKAKCDDGNPCTDDACAKDGTCSNTEIKGCVTCVDVSACDDKDPCTKDACTAGVCAYSPIAGCSKDPQLVAVSAKLSAAKADAGGKVTLTLVVNNAGYTDAGAFSVAVMLSADTTPDKADIVITTVKVDAGLGAQKTATLTIDLVVPVGASTASYSVLALVDSTDAYIEDSSDNVAGAALDVTAKPDLAIASWSTDKDFYGSATNIAFAATVKNQGGATTGVTSVLRVVFSADGNLDASDAIIGQLQTGTLAAGASANQTASLKLPTATPGTYTLFVVADAAAAVAEADENNNIVSKKIQIGQVANLYFTGFTAAQQIVAGQTLAVSYAVRNNGDTEANDHSDTLYLSKDQTYSADDIVLGTFKGGKIAVGATQAYNVTAKIPEDTVGGGWALLLVTDSGLEVPETNEADNTSTRAITIFGLPDYVGALTSASSAPPNTTATITVRVDNKGSGNAGINTVARVYRSANDVVDNGDILLGSATIQGINAGQFRTANISVNYGSTPGSYKLLTVVDATSVLTELSETNNLSILPFKVLSPADLTPSTPTLAATKIAAGDPITVNWTDTNKGDDTPTGFADGVYLSTDGVVSSADVLLGQLTSGALAGGASANRQFKGTVPTNVATGAYKILVVVDRNAQIAESDENNNLSATDVEITAPILPDLTATKPEVLAANTTINVGVDFNVQVIESNDGIADAGSSQGTWYLSTDNVFNATQDTVLLASPRPGLAAGKTATATATLRLPSATTSGTRYLFYVVDSGNAVKESNENNNVSSALAINAVARPDLVLQNMVATPNYGSSGTNVQLTFQVRNAGGANSNNFAIRAAVSVDDMIIDITKDTLVGQTSNQNGLNAGQTRNVSISFTMPTVAAGKQIGVGAMADSGKVITEASETNNTAIVPFTTLATSGKPNLFFQTASANPNQVAVGGTFNLTTTWRNLGGQATGGWKARLVFAKAPGVLDGAIEVATSNEPSINAGASVNRTWSVTVPSDLDSTFRYITVIGDYDNAIDEQVETDNTGWVQLTILQLPNLKIESIKASTTTPKPNATVTYTIVITNTGSAQATNALFALRRSSNDNITTNDQGLYYQFVTLAPGASITITRDVTATIQNGQATFWMGARIDDNGQIAESNENDNVGSVQVTVTP